MQASSTLNLVRDYVRFIITFFEVINTSASHIYHSALFLSPRTSITYEVHKKHSRPLARVVQGIPDSWEPVVATANFGDRLYDAIWSLCNRFIAVAISDFVEVLDAVTLSRLSTFDGSSYADSYQLLGFSPDSRWLTQYTGYEFISWDLQTGGPLGTIPSWPGHRDTKPFSFMHSKDGKVVAVAYKSRDYNDISDKYNTSIYTYDLLSGEHVGSCRVPEGRMIYPIWIQDGYLHFATIHPKLIRIWQSTFTLEHPPVEVTSFPIPDGITDANHFLFLPSLSRLAFILGDTIQVWDVKASKLLLESKVTLGQQWQDHPFGSFSSDGRFFAYNSTAGGVYVWEESPTGYLLHQQLPFITPSFLDPRPRLSPNGKSIIAPLHSKIHRWHTGDPVLSLPSFSTADSGRHNFILGFSFDENLAAFARRRGNTVTIIDLQSGEPKWNANVGVEVDCLGVAGGTIIVVGDDSIVTWNLPSGDCILNTSINDIVRVTILGHSSLSRCLNRAYWMSISADLSRIVVTRRSTSHWSLEVDDVSTGSCLARVETNSQLRPRFTQDGREVWAWSDIRSEKSERCEIIEDGESGAIELKHQSIRESLQPRGFFQESSRGYTVTDDWWVLSPSQKRLLWLPHCWRFSEWNRVWDGRFLGLVHGDLSEVVILEFLE